MGLLSMPSKNSRTIETAFVPRANSLNAVRLALASAVIFTHGAVVTSGSTDPRGLFDPLVGQLPVDGFFAISGFLIVRSWGRAANAMSFIEARATRLFPAYWVCLLMTAVIFAPIAAALTHTTSELARDLASWLGYPFANGFLIVFQHDIAGGPHAVPWPGDWNASLWTLKWEFACYVMAVAIGTAVRRRPDLIYLTVFVACWSASLYAVVNEVPKFVGDASRLGLMFSGGALLFLLRRRVRLSWPIIAGAIMVIGVSAAALPDYRLVAALPVSYVVLGVGILLRHPRLRLDNDISYGMYIYGFPVEQLIASTVLVNLPFLIFSAIAVLLAAPLAWGSWIFVERPALGWHRRRAARSRNHPEEMAPTPAPSLYNDVVEGALPGPHGAASLRPPSSDRRR